MPNGIREKEEKIRENETRKKAHLNYIVNRPGCSCQHSQLMGQVLVGLGQVVAGLGKVEAELGSVYAGLGQVVSGLGQVVDGSNRSWVG